MNKIHRNRLYFICLIIFGLTLATTFILYALKKNINVFLTPSDIANLKLSTDYHFRLGGMVKQGSLIHDMQGVGIRFIVTDLKHETQVFFNGILPDLFREGKGVIADGYLDHHGFFNADQILAKHDENYMPKYKSQSEGEA